MIFRNYKHILAYIAGWRPVIVTLRTTYTYLWFLSIKSFLHCRYPALADHLSYPAPAYSVRRAAPVAQESGLKKKKFVFSSLFFKLVAIPPKLCTKPCKVVDPTLACQGTFLAGRLLTPGSDHPSLWVSTLITRSGNLAGSLPLPGFNSNCTHNISRRRRKMGKKMGSRAIDLKTPYMAQNEFLK